MKAPFDLSIGVDLGGTKIEAVVLRLTPFEELARLRVLTSREEGYDAIVTRTGDLVREVAAAAGIPQERASLGVGMPGGVRRRDGLVKNSNTTCLNGRPFREDLGRALRRAITFDNDANCFALAEAKLGAGRSYAGGVVFGAILGTGVGGGVVVRGELWGGAQGIAGEWGHHGVWSGRADARACYCGQRGCLEAYLSGAAVEADYAARAGVRRTVPEIVRLRGVDPRAAEAVDSMLDAYGRGVANLIDVLDPSAIILGGGLSNLELLLTEGRARVERYVFNDELVTPILKNELGDSAGVLGAALLGAARSAASA
jgi:fructokinase